MSDGRIGEDVIDPHPDTVVLATGGVAGAGAEEGVDDRAVGVVDDSQWIGGGRGSDVGRLGDDRIPSYNVGAAYVFVQGPLVNQPDTGSTDRAPQGRGRVYHRRGLLVGDGAVERPLVHVVVHYAAGPVHRLAHHGGIEVTDPGNIFGSAGHCDRRGQREGEAQQAGRSGAGRNLKTARHGRGSNQRSHACVGPFSASNSENALIKQRKRSGTCRRRAWGDMKEEAPKASERAASRGMRHVT